jgi:hypothetical protein
MAAYVTALRQLAIATGNPGQMQTSEAFLAIFLFGLYEVGSKIVQILDHKFVYHWLTSSILAPRLQSSRQILDCAH